MVGIGSAAQGFIDDLRIYDKALSIKEAKKNYIEEMKKTCQVLDEKFKMQKKKA